MKKLSVIAALILASAFCGFAGDVASFADIGFSEDGKTYIFGQYGKTDKKFEAWAEIFTVNVEKNDFVRNENFKTEPSKNTRELTSKQCFEVLREKAEWKINKYNVKHYNPENLLYVRQGETKSPVDEIVFKDYDASTETDNIYWHIKLCPTFEGTSGNVKSSFYINVEKKDQNGNVVFSKKVGTPGVKRKNVTSYRISRIFTDNTKKNVVFVLEKTLDDSTGTSIRYMVETFAL